MEKNYYISNEFYGTMLFGDSQCLIVTGIFDEKVIEALIHNNINVLILNYAKGCKIDDYELLKKLPDSLLGFKVLGFAFDFSCLYHLKNLKYFSYAAYTKYTIDFTNFPQLEDVFLDWWPQARSIFQCNSLKKLYISGYKGKTIDEFTRLTNLEELKIGGTPMTDLSGIDTLKKLKSLCLYVFRKLDNIEELGKLERLEELEIQSNKKIKDISPIGKLKNLRKLYLNDLGRISSLKPLENLKNLEILFFYGSTVIEDGDLDFLKNFGLKDVAFANRKHYNIKSFEVPGHYGYKP